jgi:tetratricopeptide (TPR) repeat protein
MFVLIVAATIMTAQSDPLAGITIQSTGKAGDTSTIDRAKDPLGDQVDGAATLIKEAKPAEALAILDRVIATEEDSHKNEQRLIFSARSLTEAIIYSGIAGTQNKSSVILDNTWALAYFLKAFALIDLQRGEEGKAYLDKALGIAPMNAQYLAERGEWYKTRRDWAKSYDDFEAASSAAEFSPDEQKSYEKRRALRGMAYARVEQGQFKEATRLLRQCLKLDPSDEHAKQELEYIRTLK